MGRSSVPHEGRLSLGRENQSDQSTLRSNTLHVRSARRTDQRHVDQRTLPALRRAQVSEGRS